MVNVALSLGQVLVALVLVVLNGFFVAAEFALVRVRSTAVDRLVEEGRPGADVLRAELDDLDDYLAVTQLGITIASLGLGWIGEPAVAALIEPVLESLLPESVIHLVAFALGFGVITFLHVVFGELAPKTIAIARAEQIALLVALPMRAFYYLFVPGIVVFNGTANAFTRLIGIPPASETEETLTEEEILTVLTRSGSKGHVDKREVEMVERVFDLDDTTVREVMVPGPDVVSVSPDRGLSDLRSTVLEAGHTRYPVVDETDDRVVGFIDAKDVLRAVEEKDEHTTAGELARDLPVVPETGSVDDLLVQLRAERKQMAVVVDEWGAVAGLVTIEDVVEEIVGDIRDEFDVDEREPSIERRDDGTVLVDGGVPLSRANEELDAEFGGDGIETIGGLVFDRLGRAPEPGDRIEVEGFALTVDAVDGARVARVRVSERERDEPAD